MQELPPNAFRYGNYNADIPNGVFVDDDKLLAWIKRHNVVGYCLDPEFKPLYPDYVAILFDLEENGEHWSHISVRVFNRLKKEME